jgi:hypothetical protein
VYLLPIAPAESRPERRGLAGGRLILVVVNGPGTAKDRSCLEERDLLFDVRVDLPIGLELGSQLTLQR